MSSVGQDLRYAARTIKNSRGFTAVALLTLAIGIGANMAIFSFVDGILLKPLPYDGADRIVRVLEKPPQGERNSISTLNYLDWQKDNTVFEFMAAQTGGAVTLSGGGEPVLLRGGRVSARLLQDVRHQASVRPHVPRRRGPARQASGRRAQPCVLGHPVRRGSSDRQPHDSARQRCRTRSSASCRKAARSTAPSIRSGGRSRSSRRT